MPPKTIEIDGQKHLYRDLDSKALLSTNRKEIDAYHAQQRILSRNAENEKQIDEMKQKLSEIYNLRNELAELKNLVASLSNGR